MEMIVNWRRSHHVIALPTDALLARDGRPGTDLVSVSKDRDRLTTGFGRARYWRTGHGGAGLSGSAAVPRPAGSSLMPLCRSARHHLNDPRLTRLSSLATNPIGVEKDAVLPSLRTVRAVFPHTALQLVVSSSGLARSVGCCHGEQSQICEVHVWPASVIFIAASHSRSLLLLSQYRAQPPTNESV